MDCVIPYSNEKYPEGSAAESSAPLERLFRHTTSTKCQRCTRDSGYFYQKFYPSGS